MIPEFEASTFEIGTLQACLRYVADSLDWIAADDGHSKVSRELTLSTVSELTTKLQFALSRTHTLRNNYAAVHKLPLDILSSIFYELLDPFVRVCPFTTLLRFELRWLRLNCVCRRWRWAAIYSPALWAQLHIPAKLPADSSRFQRLSRSFSRSGHAPLVVFVEDSSISRLHPSLVSNIVANLPRIKDLRLFEADEDFLRRLDSNAAELTILTVNCERKKPVGTPLALFNGWQAPRLHTVVMTRCAAWEFMGPKPLLRNLILKEIDFSLATATALFNILSSTPLLEDLIFVDVTSAAEQAAHLKELGQTERSFDLPRLTRFYVKTACPTLVQLLSSIPTVSNERSCHVRYDIRPDLKFSAEEDFWPSSRLFAPTRKLDVSWGGLNGTEGELSFCLWHTGSANPFIHRILAHYECAPHVEELWLSNYHDSFARIAEDMVNVSKLTIIEDRHGGCVFGWIQAMVKFDYFPALQELWIDSGVSQCVEAFESLRAFIRRRNRTGQRIRTLRVFRVSASTLHEWVFKTWQQHSDLLAKHVDHVQFDSFAQPPYLDRPRISPAIHGGWVPF